MPQESLGGLRGRAQGRILASMNVPEFGCEYDGRWFDAPTQAWIQGRISVVHAGHGVVRIQRTPEGGMERVLEAHVAGYFKDLGLLKFDCESLYFDLLESRLLSGAARRVLTRRPAPGDHLHAPRVEAALAIVLRLAAVLGHEGPPETPRFPGWPPDESSARVAVALACGRTLLASRGVVAGRSYRSNYLRVEFDDPAVFVSLTVDAEGTCTFEARAPLELHPSAQALAERWDWT